MNALVTININNHVCSNVRESFQHSAKKWGVDYVEVTEVVTDLHHKYPPQFLKLSAFEFTEAERVFVIDADAIIRWDTPSPFSTFDEEFFVGCLNKQSHMGGYIESGRILERKEFDKIYGAGFPRMDFNFETFLNSGVWLASRRLHAETLAYALEVGLTTGTLGWWDQAALNYALAALKTHIHVADNTWNFCLPRGPWSGMSKYVYHFAGIPDRLDILPQINWRSSH